ncbi:MAG: PHP domain-containing protein [Oscillospiraceae bacterium]|nr:PHP domain-containing protein [Oscillospiraceae bacterium]
MIKLSYDMHIHSCLSPCGDDDMTPANIAGMAHINGLDVIALTDHNSCLNCPAIVSQAQKYGIIAIPGAEITTSEEIHMLCLFETLEDALDFGRHIYECLPNIINQDRIFGRQQIVDEEDNPAGCIDKLLINAASISIDDLPAAAASYNGICIPAHINKPSDSILSVFGVIPPTAEFNIAEINRCDDINALMQKHEYLRKCRIISDSDAHYLTDINEPVNYIETREKSIESIFESLRTNKS